MEQRWLSLTGICTSLGLSAPQIKSLVKQRILVTIKAQQGEIRYLDPTPEFAERLRLGESLYCRMWPIPKELDISALLTLREFAQVMGWTMKYARRYCKEKKVPNTKIGFTTMYSIATVRGLLW